MTPLDTSEKIPCCPKEHVDWLNVYNRQKEGNGAMDWLSVLVFVKEA